MGNEPTSQLDGLTVGNALTVCRLFYEATKIKIKNDSGSTVKNVTTMESGAVINSGI